MLAVTARPWGSPGMSFTSMVPQASGSGTVRTIWRRSRSQKRKAPRSSTGPGQPASVEAGQVGMLDISDPARFTQQAVVDLGVGTGPHLVALTDDDRRLVVVDYFLEEDRLGTIHFEGDRLVHVLKVTHDTLEADPRFQLDFKTAFEFPARPHGVAMK